MIASAAPRLRVFAGPNGSGKSTIKDALKPEWLGVYVNNRVRSGGHPVPPEKIRERYYRSLHLLPQAIDQSSRAYVFDNSGDDRLLLAEISDYGENLRLEEAAIRPWFAPVLQRYL